MEKDKWKTYRTEYCKEFRNENPNYHYDYYHDNKDKYDEYIKKRIEQKQRIKLGLEPMPRIRRTKFKLEKMREERKLKVLKQKSEQFKETLKLQNTN